MDQQILDLVFNKYTCKDGYVIYWRECVEEFKPGFLWVFENGDWIHMYGTPEKYNL